MSLWWLPVLLAAAAVPWALPRVGMRRWRAGPVQGSVVGRNRVGVGVSGTRGGDRRNRADRAGRATGQRRRGAIPMVEGGRIARWRRRAGPATTDSLDIAVLADILGAAIASGASIPAALGALGRAVPGEQGQQFVRVAATLGLGGNWSSAWAQADAQYQVLARALQPAWEDGVAPGSLLTHAAGQIRRRRAEAAREAAARLGVRLVLPMGLCWLPAFVLLGLAPVLLSTGGSLWP